MSRRDAIRAAIREALVATRAARARRFAAETQPDDTWIEDAAWLAEQAVHETETETEGRHDPCADLTG